MREGENKTWAEANAEGRRAATVLITEMKAGERPFLLGDSAKLMIEKGTFGGFEVGFFQKIAEEIFR